MPFVERHAGDVRASRRRRRSGAASRRTARAGRGADGRHPRAAVIDVPAPGPLLPAEALTEIPALNASRNASSTGSVYGLRAARDREVDHVDAVDDRLLDRGDRVGAEAALRRGRRGTRSRARPARCRRPGRGRRRTAPPRRRSRRRPSSSCACRDPRSRAASTSCVVLLQNSWPSEPTFAMYVSVNAYAPISLLLQVNVGPRWATSLPSPNWQRHGGPPARRGDARRRQHRMLRPDAGVDDADDDVRAGVAASRRATATRSWRR